MICRRVAGCPRSEYFKPAGIPLSGLEEVRLTRDELEALRLADLEGLYQAEAAAKMGVSRQTFGNIVESARHKVAAVLVKGRALRIQGGVFQMTDSMSAKKICVPTKTNEGLKARVYGHFGSAPFFTIVDVEGKSVEVVDNGNRAHAHGQCHPIASLQGREVDAVITGGMGSRAVQMFHDSGIKVFRAEAGTVEETVQKYAGGRLEEITLEDGCRHHGGCR